MAVLGMRGTGNFALVDERPTDYRQYVLLLFPNGQAPLTAILSMLGSEGCGDALFHWYEKSLPVQRATVVGASLTTGSKPADDADVAPGGARPDTVAMTVKPDGGSEDDISWIKVGHIVMVESTGENLMVKSKATDYILLERDIGNKWASSSEPGISGQADGSGDHIVIVGSGFHEGSELGQAIAYAPLLHFNYAQIFRTPLFLTRTARKTKLLYDKTGPYREAKREALQLHAIEMEKAFIFGERHLLTAFNETPDAPFDTGLGTGQPLRFTRGIVNWLPAPTTTTSSVHIDIATGYSGVLSEVVFDTWCEEIFRYGSDEKLLLAGSTFINVLNQLAKNKLTITALPTNETYGMNLKRVTTAFGDLILKQHPLFSHNPIWRKDALCLDVEKLKYRFIDDTDFLLNRQNPGTDGSKDEFLTEAGLEAHFTGCLSDAGLGAGLATGYSPSAHGRLIGVATYGG